MTRRAWTAVIVVVAVIVAAVAGTALVAATHHRSEPTWPRGTLSVQSGRSGQGWNAGSSQYGTNGHDGGGYRWGGGNGMGQRFGRGMMDRGIWQPLRGLPWLVLGLFIGAGVTVLIWQPWKRPAPAATGAAGAAGAAAAGGAQGTADQWAQWHRDLHAADRATTQPIATAGPATEAEATLAGGAPGETDAAGETSAAAAPDFPAAEPDTPA